MARFDKVMPMRRPQGLFSTGDHAKNQLEC